MQLDFTKTNGLEGQLKLVVGVDDYEKEVSKSLKTYQKNMNFPGFRKGKAPLGLVKKQIGQDIVREEINKLIQQKINDYYQEEKENIIFLPIMQDVDDDYDWSANKDHAFDFRVALKPEVNLSTDVLKDIESFELKISKDDVDREIEELRKQYGDIDKTEEVVDDDKIVTVFRAVELDDSGEELKDGFTKMVRISGDDFTDKIKKILVGKKSDEKFEVNISKELNQKDVMSLFEIDKPTLKDLNPNFRFEMQGSILITPAELNEEFFAKVFNDDSIKTEEDFRAKLEQNLKDFFGGKDERHLQPEVKKTLLEKTELELPEDFIEAWYKRNANLDKIEEGELPKRIEDFKETTKWDLILDKLATDLGVEVSESEIKDAMKAYIYQQYGQQMAGMDPEQLDKMADSLYEQEHFRIELRQNIVENKVVKELKNKTIFTQKSLTKPEFEEFSKNNNL